MLRYGVTDLRQFFAVIEDARDLAIFTLMLRCGLRIGEVANLQLPDLYLDEDYPRMLVRGKGSRQRVVYLSSQALRLLHPVVLHMLVHPSLFGLVLAG